MNIFRRSVLPVIALFTLISTANAADSSIEKGEYLVGLLGCERCHTEGYLTEDAPAGPPLAGSTVGIAYTSYKPENDNPGVVFPGNLTPDPETGIGSWSRTDLLNALTHGARRDGHERLNVMPWTNYGAIKPDDLSAIATYLMNLEPVKRRIPDPVMEGTPSREDYVRFGTYRFTPFWHLGTDPEREGATLDQDR